MNMRIFDEKATVRVFGLREENAVFASQVQLCDFRSNAPAAEF